MSDPSSAALTEAYTLIAHQQLQLSELRERHNNTVAELEALQVRYQTVCGEKEALTRPITEDQFDSDSITFPASPTSQVQFLKNQIVELQNAKFNVQLQNSALQSEIQSLKVSSFKRSTSIDTLSRLSDERVSELQQQVQALQTEISNLQANNTVILGEKASMQYQVQALRAELSRVAALSTPALPTTVDSTLQQQLEAEKMAHLSYITEVAASRRAAQTAHDAEVQAFNSRIDVLQRRAECAETVVDSLRAQSRDFELENINLRAEIQRFQSDLQTQRTMSAAETMRFIAEIEKLTKDVSKVTSSTGLIESNSDDQQAARVQEDTAAELEQVKKELEQCKLRAAAAEKACESEHLQRTAEFELYDAMHNNAEYKSAYMHGRLW